MEADTTQKLTDAIRELEYYGSDDASGPRESKEAARTAASKARQALVYWRQCVRIRTYADKG